MDIEIPANATATVYVPAANAGTITESGKAVSTLTDVKVSGTENGYVLLQVGSGKYHFATAK